MTHSRIFSVSKVGLFSHALRSILRQSKNQDVQGIPLRKTFSKFSPLSQLAGVNLSIGEDKVLKSFHKDIVSVQNVLVPDFIQSHEGRNWGDQIAFECSTTGMRITHNELFEHAKSFGAAILKCGLKRGDTVGLFIPNCPQYPEIMFGLLQTGIIGSLMNPLYTPDEVKSLVAQTNTKAIITLPQFMPLINAVKSDPAASSLKTVITLGEAPQGCHNYFEMIKTNPAGTEFIRASDIDTVNDPAMILWSSGTTGPPKGVKISHENICSVVLQLSRSEISNYEPGKERLFGMIPFFHIYGAMSMMFWATRGGAKVVTLPKFDPTLFTKVVKTHKPTYFHLVPPLVSFVASNPALTKEDFESIHSVICGAAPTGPSLISKFLEKAEKHIFFQEGFGMTETTGLCHIIPQKYNDNSRSGSIGELISKTSAIILDVETGKRLGPNENGEICLKGPQITKGYLNNEEATKHTIDSEGWLHTGDIGHFTDEGVFYIVDRLKELIKVKGLQVAPSELEDVLRKHEKIADIAVIGVPDDRAGELPRAYVVRKDSSLTQDDINNYLHDKVAAHKHLKGGIEFVDAIPKSAAGKILRRQILDHYKTTYIRK